MIKKNKIILSTLCSSACLVGITVGVAAPLLVQMQNKTAAPKTRMTTEDWYNNKPFEFNGKEYININDAFNDLVNEIGGINPQQFIGQVYNKNEDGSVILSNNPVREYDLHRIYKAYMDANGRYTADYSKAIKSFVNVSNLQEYYYDYRGNYFINEADAKENMLTNIKTMGIAYYKIKDRQGKEYKINPLNSIDILKFKEIAYDYLINPNSANNPFNLKIVYKDKNNENSDNKTTYSKSNEFTHIITEQWKKFNEIFKQNLIAELSNKIMNVLRNNAIIETEIFIKPYILSHNLPQDEAMENIDYFKYPETKRVGWHFKLPNGDWSTKIKSKSLNYTDFKSLADIFLTRNQFENNFSISSASFPSGGCSPDYEKATLKPDSKIKEYLGLSNLTIDLHTRDKHQGSLLHIDNYKVATILKKSDWVIPNLGPHYGHNYMLTFGVKPKIDEKAKINIWSWENANSKQSNNSKLIEFKDFLKLLTGKQANNLDLYSQIIENSYNKTYEQIKKENKKELLTFLDQHSVSDMQVMDLSTTNLYRDNIFNRSVLKAFKGKTIPHLSKKLFNLFHNIVFSNWNGNEKFDDFNSAIDMHQFTYYMRKNNTTNFDHILGDVNNFIDNFITIGTNSNGEVITLKNDNENGLNKEFKYIITYNQMPVFEINQINDERMKKYLRILLDSQGYTTKNLNPIKIEQDILNELFKNISMNYTLENNTTNLNKSIKYKITPDEHNISIANNKNQFIVKGTENYKPTLVYLPTSNKEAPPMTNGIYDSISLYNQNVKKIPVGNSQISNSLLEKNKPKDFLMLFDPTGTNGTHVMPTPLYYAETIQGIDNINLSLSQPKENAPSLIATTFNAKKELLSRFEIFDSPLQVYFIYHNDNLLIGERIENSNNSPTFIDNPELVIENALRTYGLAAEKEYIMYLENDYQTYTKILNNVFVLYSYTLENKKYYFDSYSSSKNKLIEYIKYNSFKI